MDRNTWKRVERLFYEAIERPASEWPGILDEACGSDRELQREVEALLAHHERTGDLFDAPRALAGALLRGSPDPARADPVVEGHRLGPYRLEREIGSGGMGRVFLARREDLPKQVALKLVRGPLASPDRVRRFAPQEGCCESRSGLEGVWAGKPDLGCEGGRRYEGRSGLGRRSELGSPTWGRGSVRASKAGLDGEAPTWAARAVGATKGGLGCES